MNCVFEKMLPDPMVDYFEERMNAKKERVSKNEMQRLKNMARSRSKATNSNAIPIGIGTDLQEKTKEGVRFFL